jgi:hypothetical protein
VDPTGTQVSPYGLLGNVIQLNDTAEKAATKAEEIVEAAAEPVIRNVIGKIAPRLNVAFYNHRSVG